MKKSQLRMLESGKGGNGARSRAHGPVYDDCIWSRHAGAWDMGWSPELRRNTFHSSVSEVPGTFRVKTSSEIFQQG